jgi:hypothetical protein
MLTRRLDYLLQDCCAHSSRLCGSGHLVLAVDRRAASAAYEAADDRLSAAEMALSEPDSSKPTEPAPRRGNTPMTPVRRLNKNGAAHLKLS